MGLGTMADHRKDRPETDSPRVTDRAVWAIVAICAVLFAIDWFVPKHGPFGIEHAFGFYGIYGFLAGAGLVLVAGQLRRVLMRPEDYYDG